MNKNDDRLLPTVAEVANRHRRLPSRRKLKYLLLAGLVMLQVVTVGGILLSQHIEGREALRSHVQQIMTGVMGELKENAHGFLTPAGHAATIAQGLFSSGMLSLSRAIDLERFFFHQLETVAQLNGMFFGDPLGQFVYVARATGPGLGAYQTKIITVGPDGRETVRIWRDAEFGELERRLDPDDTYDPRNRPWYRKAVRDAELIWTDPYIFFTSRQPGITTAAPVIRDGAIEGVIGVDIEISALSRFLAGQEIAEHGSAFVLDSNGNVVAHSHKEPVKFNAKDDRLRLMRADEVGDPVESAAIQILLNGQDNSRTSCGFNSFRRQGKLYHVVCEPFSADGTWPWTIGVYAADREFVGPLRASQRQSAIIAVMIGVVITLLAFVLAQRFVAPVAALEEEASLDVLTRLLNRRRLFQLGPELVNEAVRKRQPLCSVMFDIDRFKVINDEYGHAVGDEVLKAITQRVRGVVAGSDLLARYGGDEFKLFLRNADQDTGLVVAERLRQAVGESPIDTSAGSISVTISIGVVALDPERADFSDLLKTVDDALFEAKRLGRNRVSAGQQGALGAG